METSGFSRQLYKSILVHSTMSILTIGLAVSVVSIGFLYFKLKSELANNLAHSLRIRTMTIDEFTSRAQDIALQITSRSKLRQKLDEFNNGGITRDQLESFSTPLLSDAMKQSREIAGISRLDADGRLAVGIGLPVPQVAWPVPGASGERVLIRGPLMLEGRQYLVLGASIIGEENKRVGTDVILFETVKLQNILRDYTGLGEKGEAVLGVPGRDGINLLVPLRQDRDKAMVLPPDSPFAGALGNAFLKKPGMSSAGPSIIAYGPLTNTDWALAVRMDKGELYSPMYREMFIMAIVTLLLILAGYYVMIMALRPLTKSILLKAGDLEKQIHEKTSQLEESAGALRDEKNLLANKNSELEKAYADLKAAQSRLLQQEKMACIGQLAAGVAHEINTPIGFIISNLNTLEKYTVRFTELIKAQSEALNASPSVGKDLIDRINEQRRQAKIDYIVNDAGTLIRESLEGAERVKVIVQDLKNFSRIDQTEWKTDDINAGIESTINMVWNELKHKVAVKRQYGDISPVRCNIRELNQAFMNLLVNAAQSIKEQGEVGIKTWSEGENVYISISDNGCGVPAANLDRIFEPFFTTKEVGEGAGLGLSIAYDIVMRHNGKLEVLSEEGKGTTFTVRIPVAGIER